MVEKKKTTKPKPRTSSSQQGIWVIADVVAAPNAGVEYFGGARIPRSVAELTDDWKATLSQVAKVIEQAGPAAVPSGFQLEQIEVSLGVTAEGGLAFIAKAGIQASLKVVLKRA